MRRLARRFIGGEHPAEIVALAGRLWADGAATTVDLLGEKTVTAAEADTYAARVGELLDALDRGRAPLAAEPAPGGRPLGRRCPG